MIMDFSELVTNGSLGRIIKRFSWSVFLILIFALLICRNACGERYDCKGNDKNCEKIIDHQNGMMFSYLFSAMIGCLLLMMLSEWKYFPMEPTIEDQKKMKRFLILVMGLVLTVFGLLLSSIVFGILMSVGYYRRCVLLMD